MAASPPAVAAEAHVRIALSKWTWACFECRKTVRREAPFPGPVVCALCGEESYLIGMKFRLPPRRDAKAWKKIHTELLERDKEFRAGENKASVQMRHQVERTLRKIEALEENGGRKSLVKRLKRELGES